MSEFDRDFTSEPSISRFPAKTAPGAAPKPAPAFSPAPLPAISGDSPIAAEVYAPPATGALRLARFVDLACAAPTPFALALMASAGGGKTSALGWVAARAQKFGAATARFDAADLAAEPERALAAGFYRALAPTHGPLVAEAAREAEEAGAAQGAAQDRLDALRKTLIVERQALADHQARRAALPETVLYDLPGTAVDHFARKMRGGFAARMAAFGLSGDPLLTFKDLTRDLAALEGTGARLRACFRTLHAYRGQTTLLVYAALLYALSQGLDWASAHKADWLGWLSRAHEAGAQTADFLRDRLGALDTAASLALLAALVCLGLNFWRAYAFAAPLLRAAKKLDEDVAARAPEAEEAVAAQARVVERLAAQKAAARRLTAESERRAEDAEIGAAAPAFLERDPADHKRDQARAFLRAVSAGLAAKNARLLAIVDGFEQLRDGAALFQRLGALLARPGVVAVFALDPGLSDGETLARHVQLPLRLNAGVFDPPAYAALDASLSPLEERLLVALTPLAGEAPRAKKRLRNFYLFLRPIRGGDDKIAPALAFALAAEMGGGAAREALETLVAGGHPDVARAPALADAFKAAQDIGGPIDAETLRRATVLARVLAG